MLEGSQSLLQCYNNIANCKIPRTMDPPLHYKMMEHLLSRASAVQNRKKQTIVVICSDIETGAKLSEAIGTVEELSTSHDEWTTTGQEERESKEEEKQAMCNE